MRRIRRGLVVLTAALATLVTTAMPALAAHAPGIKGAWVRGGTSPWLSANSAFGPLESARIFYPKALPASYVGSQGSDIPDGVTLIVSYNTATTNVASYVCSVPPTRNMIVNYYHEPEQRNNQFATGADFVTAFVAQSTLIRNAAASCGLTNIKVAMIALPWSYADATRRGYACSFIPPASSVDYYLGDHYDPNQVGMAKDPGFQRWVSCTAGSGVPLGLAEQGIGLGVTTPSGCQFTDARRATVLQADDAYLAANFPDFMLWEYFWGIGDKCWDSWQFPSQGQTADTWRAIASGAPLPPVILVEQPSPNATVRGTVVVSGTTSGPTDIASVAVSVDGGAPATATGTSTWSDAIDTTALPDGQHTITIQATDVNGIPGTTSQVVTVSNTVPASSCPAPPAGASELSGNVSLESAQTGWTGLYNANSTVTRVAPTGGSFDGTWALQMAPKATGLAGVNNAKPFWVPGPPGVATTAGHVYTGSAFTRANTAGEKAVLLVKELSSSGALVGSAKTTVTLGDTNWHQISTPYTAKASGDQLRYSLYVSNFTGTGQRLLADCLSLQVQ